MITTSYPRSPLDSAGIFIQSLVIALEKAGVSGRVVAPGESSIPVEQREGSFDVHRAPYAGGTLAYSLGIFPNIRRYPLRILQIPFLLTALLKGCLSGSKKGVWEANLFQTGLAETFDIYHGQWVISGLIAAVAAAVKKKPFVVSVRGQDARLLTLPVIGLMFRTVLKRAAKVHVVSESLRRLVSTFVSSEKVCLIYNGISASAPDFQRQAAFAKKYDLDTNQKYLVYVGRRIPLKGIPRLFQILKNPAFAGYQLLCFGAGESDYDSELTEEVIRQSLQGRVHFFSELPPAEVSIALSCATFVVSGSYSEGRPNGLLEGLALGKVCIASGIPAHQELSAACPAVVLYFDETVATPIFQKAFSPGLSEVAKMYAAQFTWAAAADEMRQLYVSAAQTPVKK